MTELQDLERRIRTLEEIEAIKRLKYRYWRDLDLKQWDDLADCFSESCTASYGDGKYTFRGAVEIMKFLRASLGEHTGSVTVHQGHHPEIDITGPTTAKGTWALYNYMYNQTQNRGIRIAAFYEDAFVKVDGEWKFQHIGYRSLFHEEWKRDDIPSLRLLAG